MTRRQRRLSIIGGSLAILAIAAALVLNALSDSILFFSTPQMVAEKHIRPGKRFRLGGLVQPGSLVHGDNLAVTFRVADGSTALPVSFKGILPDLFREGQGVVAEGALDPSGVFRADTVLAKHDETYMPKEVADALKKQGHWKDDYAAKPSYRANTVATQGASRWLRSPVIVDAAGLVICRCARSAPLKQIVGCLFAVAMMVGSSAAYAVQPDEIMSDPAKEARARSLSRELRCMVCQNQSIDDSEAPLARDLRLLVRERIAAGDSDPQVIDFLVARYGEFVLLKPRLEPHTLLLWLLPPLVLAGGGLALWMHGRRRSAMATDSTVVLTPEEEARLAALIAAEAPPEKSG